MLQMLRKNRLPIPANQSLSQTCHKMNTKRKYQGFKIIMIFFSKNRNTKESHNRPLPCQIKYRSEHIICPWFYVWANGTGISFNSFFSFLKSLNFACELRGELGHLSCVWGGLFCFLLWGCLFWWKPGRTNVAGGFAFARNQDPIVPPLQNWRPGGR